MINGKHGQGTHCTKMGADKLAENTPNAQIVCQSPKVWDFDEKRLHWASVVRVYKVLKIVRCKNAGAENSSRKTMIAESTRQFSRPTM